MFVAGAAISIDGTENIVMLKNQTTLTNILVPRYHLQEKKDLVDNLKATGFTVTNVQGDYATLVVDWGEIQEEDTMQHCNTQLAIKLVIEANDSLLR